MDMEWIRDTWHYKFFSSIPFRGVEWIFVSVWILWLHLYRRVSLWIVGPSLFVIFVLFEGMGFAGSKEDVRLLETAGVLFLYGTLVYVLLCECLKKWWAAWLTERRGEKWVKEIDYLYLSLGSVGIFGVVNRLESISDPYAKVDVYAALLLATAVVVRLIKVRAEIEGWNKLPTIPTPASPSAPPASIPPSP